MFPKKNQQKLIIQSVFALSRIYIFNLYVGSTFEFRTLYTKCNVYTLTGSDLLNYRIFHDSLYNPRAGNRVQYIFFLFLLFIVKVDSLFFSSFNYFLLIKSKQTNNTNERRHTAVTDGGDENYFIVFF